MVLYFRNVHLDLPKIFALFWTPVLSRHGEENLTSRKNHLVHRWPTSFIRANYVQPPQTKFFPYADATTKKAQQLIKTLLSEGRIDKTTAKWLFLTPDPPRIPVFYTLNKIHKPTPVGRPFLSGCSGPTERISAFVDHLIQPIAQLQASYLKDTTDFANIFMAKIEKEIHSDRAALSPSFGKGLSMTSYQYGTQAETK